MDQDSTAALVPESRDDHDHLSHGPPEPPRLSKPSRHKYQQYLETVQKRHQQLAQTRVERVIERVNLRSKLEEIRPHREKAGDTEAAFVTSLRQFCEQQGINLPPEISAQYQEVQIQRDILGKLEDDFFEAQKSFSASEWRFIEEEEDFYKYDIRESFPADDGDEDTEMWPKEPPISSTTSLPAAETNTATLNSELVSTAEEKKQLEEQFDELRQQEVEHMDDQNLRTLAKFPTPPNIIEEKKELQQQACIVIKKSTLR